jgi:hypothetical protein
MARRTAEDLRNFVDPVRDKSFPYERRDGLAFSVTETGGYFGSECKSLNRKMEGSVRDHPLPAESI